MTENVIDKAEALMRRHRAFVAGDTATTAARQGDFLRSTAPARPEGSTLGVPTSDRTAEPEDLPVLTEMVASIDEAALPAAIATGDIETLLQERLAAALPQQREVLRRELALWLDEQLPQLVMRVLDGVTDQLVAQINTQARMTLLPKLQAALDPDAETPTAD